MPPQTAKGFTVNSETLGSCLCCTMLWAVCNPLVLSTYLPLGWYWWFIFGGMDYMSTKVCLIVQVSFTVNSETLPCSGGYDIASMTGAHNCRNSMTGNNFTVDSETICDTVVCVYVLRKR